MISQLAFNQNLILSDPFFCDICPIIVRSEIVKTLAVSNGAL
jgi:hypothetical protein